VTGPPDDSRSNERVDVDQLVNSLIGPTNTAAEQPSNVLPVATTADTAKVATETKDNQVVSRNKLVGNI